MGVGERDWERLECDKLLHVSPLPALDCTPRWTSSGTLFFFLMYLSLGFVLNFAQVGARFDICT